MRIFGLFLFGLSSVIFLVITLVFFSFYRSFSNTEYLFDQYKSSGVYSDISSAVKSQVAQVQDPSYEPTPEEAIQSQIQEQFISVLISEESVEEMIERNLTNFNSYVHSDQKTFSIYTPFGDSSKIDSMMAQMGLGELAQDPEFKKMFEESSKNMMAQNNPLESVGPLAENLKTSLTVLRFLLPILTVISLVIFIILGRGIGRIRNIGILSLVVSLNLGVSYFISRTLYIAGNQSGGWGDDNIGTQIASGILSPVILISADWIGKCALFALIMGIVCIIVWVVMKMNNSKNVKKVPVQKKRT